MAMVVMRVIRITLATRPHFSHAASGTQAKNVVNVKYASISTISTSCAFQGIGFRSRVNSSPASVTPPTTAAQRKSRAKPHMNHCGLIMPIQYHTRTPIHGRAKHTGSRPNTRAANSTSRIVTLLRRFRERNQDPTLQCVQEGNPADQLFVSGRYEKKAGIEHEIGWILSKIAEAGDLKSSLLRPFADRPPGVGAIRDWEYILLITTFGLRHDPRMKPVRYELGGKRRVIPQICSQEYES